MRAIVMALSMALAGAAAGCGFKPMLAPSENGVAIGPIDLPEIPGKSGHVFRTELERLLDAERGQGPLRRMEVVLKEDIQQLGLRVDESATRADLQLSASYTLFDGSGVMVLTGSANAIASYDIPASAYGEVAAQNDARERAAQILAEKVRTDLALRLARRKAS